MRTFNVSGEELQINSKSWDEKHFLRGADHIKCTLMSLCADFSNAIPWYVTNMNTETEAGKKIDLKGDSHHINQNIVCILFTWLH